VGVGKVEKVMEESWMVMFKSKNVVIEDGSSICHSSLPQLFSFSLNSFQTWRGFFVGGSQMPNMSSM
jgi:hypothetical protein